MKITLEKQMLVHFLVSSYFFQEFSYYMFVFWLCSRYIFGISLPLTYYEIEYIRKYDNFALLFESSITIYILSPWNSINLQNFKSWKDQMFFDLWSPLITFLNCDSKISSIYDWDKIIFPLIFQGCWWILFYVMHFRAIINLRQSIKRISKIIFIAYLYNEC